MLESSCHCGAVTIAIAVDTPPAEVTSCNCSICRRLGSLWAYYEPAQVRGLSGVIGAATAYTGDHTCALTGDGLVHCWGRNRYGALGDGTLRDSTEPRLVEGVTARLDQGQGVLILTDLYGDTPSNLSLGLIRPGRIEVVTGVNLPMVLRLSCTGARPLELAELARWIQEKGRQGIRVGEPVPADAVEERVG